jgi:16S rRNA (guanine527-N7)-methyltransferase
MSLVRQPSVQSQSTWGREATLQLDRGLARLGVAATPAQLDRLRTYGALLLKWNRTYNLLGATSAELLVEEHLLDSLAIIPALTRWLAKQHASAAPDESVGIRGTSCASAAAPCEPQRLVDVGTGAGLPGLVLAIMLADLEVTLVEPIGKKTAFLRQAVAECRVPRVTILEAKLEELTPAALHGSGNGRPQPHFICRAFTSLERFAEICKPHIQPGSLLFAMKALRVTEELEQLGSSTEVLAVEPLDTLRKDVQRNLVVMRAVSPA